MATVFETLQRASFVGYPFPVRSIDVKGGIRKKMHQYPKAPGAATEKLGRKPYEFELVGIFDARIGPTAGYPARLWPDTLATLRTFMEGGGTYDLVVPTIGTIQAYADDWHETATSKRLSGVEATFRFTEDTTNDFLIDKLVQISVNNTQNLTTGLPIIAAQEGVKSNIFDAIKALGDKILAVGDQIELQGDILAGAAEGIASLCQQADSTISALAEPQHFALAAALHDVWNSAIKLNQDSLQKALPMIQWTVPAQMGIVDVAAALYGDTSRALEVMKLNAINNPLLIQPGTTLKVYAP